MVLNLNRLSERLDRAKRATGRKVKYRLGAGGFNPWASHPANSANQCDCSGFAAWLLPMSRDLGSTGKASKFGFRWIETTNIVRDARGPKRLFVKLETPVPGAFVVWGDSLLGQGHIGLIVRQVKGRKLRIIDCSSGSSRRFGDAICEREMVVPIRAIFVTLAEDVLA